MGLGSDKLDREAGMAGEGAAGRDRRHKLQAKLIESRRRNHDDGAAPALFVAMSWIEVDDANVAAFDQMRSPPTGRSLSHISSSPESGALGSHCASNSSNL